ncbi:glycosyltransferase [Nitrincola sp.]|uniref:glycosyltransferase n=1 Tax=Nitrincola sp. TaxID=1926584 RepID=UPI003A9196AF
MIASHYKLIIVTPVYEDVEASTRLFEELYVQFGKEAYVVVVDDGSIKQPVKVESLNQAGVNGVVLKLRCNVGHQRAIAVGLGYVSEIMQPDQLVIVMDSDGEDLPDTITALITQLGADSVDVVVAERKSRVETFRFKLFYTIYKRFFNLMTGRSISFGNFMALKFVAVKRLVAMPELMIHVAGAVIASKLRAGICPLDRGSRYAGQSKMNFVGLVLHGFKGLMVFAEDVLVRVGIACAGIASCSILGAVAAILLKLIGFSTPGWFSIALGILVLMFLQTGALALMTLMLTGVVRGGSVTTAAVYREYIDEIIESNNV